jgi:hypothetical protein
VVEETQVMMNIKSQAQKEQIISELQKVRSNILTEVLALSTKQRNTVFLGVWSVKDLLAHLAGWDFTNVDAIKSVMAGKVPSFYEYRDHDWQTYNAMLVEKYKGNSFREVIATVKRSQKELIKLLKPIPPECFSKDFDVRFRGTKLTIQRFLEADIKDVQIHHRQIVDFFGKAK